MSAPRDPLVSPAAGDVLLSGSMRMEVLCVDFDGVRVRHSGRGKVMKPVTLSLYDWRRDMQIMRATVERVAEVPS